MKRWVFVFVTLGLIFTLFAQGFASSLAAPAEGEAPLKQYGMVTVEAIEAEGLMRLHGTTVTRLLSVKGTLLSHSAKIEKLDVLGEANFTDTAVRGEAKIVGYLQAHKTSFEKPLQLTAQKAVFVASQLKGITISQDPVFKGKQVLELKQRTLVDGPIDFQGQKGEVHLYSGSQVLGAVTGGKVLRK